MSESLVDPAREGLRVRSRMSFTESRNVTLGLALPILMLLGVPESSPQRVGRAVLQLDYKITSEKSMCTLREGNRVKAALPGSNPV